MVRRTGCCIRTAARGPSVTVSMASKADIGGDGGSRTNVFMKAFIVKRPRIRYTRCLLERTNQSRAARSPWCNQHTDNALGRREERDGPGTMHALYRREELTHR